MARLPSSRRRCRACTGGGAPAREPCLSKPSCLMEPNGGESPPCAPALERRATKGMSDVGLVVLPRRRTFTRRRPPPSCLRTPPPPMCGAGDARAAGPRGERPSPGRRPPAGGRRGAPPPAGRAVEGHREVRTVWRTAIAYSLYRTTCQLSLSLAANDLFCSVLEFGPVPRHPWPMRGNNFSSIVFRRLSQSSPHTASVHTAPK